LTVESDAKMSSSSSPSISISITPVCSVCRLSLPFLPSKKHTVLADLDVLVNDHRYFVTRVFKVASDVNADLRWRSDRMPGEDGSKMTWLPLIEAFPLVFSGVDEPTGLSLAFLPSLDSPPSFFLGLSIQNVGFSIHYCAADHCRCVSGRMQHDQQIRLRMLFPELARLEIDRPVSVVEPTMLAVLEQDQASRMPTRELAADREALDAEIEAKGLLEENEGLLLAYDGTELGERRSEELEDPSVDFGDLNDEREEENVYRAHRVVTRASHGVHLFRDLEQNP
jgi:hypothetical protein